MDETETFGQRTDRASRRLHGVSLAGIVALALLLRALFLGQEGFWYDEGESVHFARTDGLASLAARLWHEHEPNMSLYYALLNIWMSLGSTESVVRALSVLFAVITIPLVYLLGDRLFGRRTGLLASLLLALNLYHIDYSREARSYALLVLLTVLASLLFVSAIRRSTWSGWALYTVTIVLAIYSHFFAAFVAGAHGLSLALLRQRNFPWRQAVMSTCLAGVLLIPLGIFVLATKNMAGHLTGIPRPGPDAVPRLLSYLATGAPVARTPVGGRLDVTATVARRLLLFLYVGWVCIALVSAGQLRSRQTKSFETWAYAFLLLWLLVPPIVAYLVSFIIPIFFDRYLIVSLVPLILLAANGLSRIRSMAMSAIALIALVSLAALQATAYYHFPRKEDWRGAVEYIATQARPEDAVVVYTGSPYNSSVAIFEYYRNRYRPRASSILHVLPLVDALREKPPRIWLVLAHIDTSQAATAESQLALEHVAVDNKRFFGDIQVLLYQAE
jgi:uncharacterized membrane protein